MINWIGSGRSSGGRHSPSEDRGTSCRSALPIALRSWRDVGRRRSEEKASLSALASTVCPGRCTVAVMTITSCPVICQRCLP